VLGNPVVPVPGFPAERLGATPSLLCFLALREGLGQPPRRPGSSFRGPEHPAWRAGATSDGPQPAVFAVSAGAAPLWVGTWSARSWQMFFILEIWLIA
jgi:hypothetical protein